MAASRRLVRERPSRPDTHAPARPARAQSTVVGPDGRQSMLDLQRHAGNAAVTGLLQRAPLGTTDDPKGYTSAAGVKNVAASGMTRREVHGLTYGIKGGFQSKYTGKSWDKATGTWKRKVRPSAEAKMTKESPDNL